MRDQDVDAGGEAPGGAGAVNGALPVASKRSKRRTWSVEEKIRIARESFAPSETITAVANRHGVSRSRLSSWRTQLREGRLVLGSSALPGGAFAAVEVEERCSVVIEGRGVTVRLEGIADTAGIAAIAAALTSGLR